MAQPSMGIGSVTEHLRAVFDTNIFVSATLSRNPTSPNKELMERWQRDEFSLLTCAALTDELIEKLLEFGIDQDDVLELLSTLLALAEWVDVPEEAITPQLIDKDDNVVLACAIMGRADYLVTYDPHFDSLGGNYQGIRIVKALPFLWAVRGDQPPAKATLPLPS